MDIRLLFPSLVLLSVTCSISPSQAIVENLVKEYPNVLILRVRMPIVADLTYPRNFITKIIKYDKVGPLSLLQALGTVCCTPAPLCACFMCLTLLLFRGVPAGHQHPQLHDRPARAAAHVAGDGEQDSAVLGVPIRAPAALLHVPNQCRPYTRSRSCARHQV